MRMIDLRCPSCDHVWFDQLVHLADLPVCDECQVTTERAWFSAPTVRPDSIPGGLWIKHGLCNEDGTPRRYDSHSEITLECEKRGLVRWSDIHEERQTKDARVRQDWYQSSEAQKARQGRVEARKEKALAKARRQAEVAA